MQHHEPLLLSRPALLSHIFRYTNHTNSLRRLLDLAEVSPAWAETLLHLSPDCVNKLIESTSRSVFVSRFILTCESGQRVLLAERMAAFATDDEYVQGIIRSGSLNMLQGLLRHIPADFKTGKGASTLLTDLASPGGKGSMCLLPRGEVIRRTFQVIGRLPAGEETRRFVSEVNRLLAQGRSSLYRRVNPQHSEASYCDLNYVAEDTKIGDMFNDDVWFSVISAGLTCAERGFEQRELNSFLDTSAAWHDVDAVHLLLKAGADPNATSSYDIETSGTVAQFAARAFHDTTALPWDAEKRRRHAQIILLLSRFGAKLPLWSGETIGDGDPYNYPAGVSLLTVCSVVLHEFDRTHRAHRRRRSEGHAPDPQENEWIEDEKTVRTCCSK